MIPALILQLMAIAGWMNVGGQCVVLRFIEGTGADLEELTHLRIRRALLFSVIMQAAAIYRLSS